MKKFILITLMTLLIFSGCSSNNHSGESDEQSVIQNIKEDTMEKESSKLTFFDSKGMPVAYSDDKVDIYLFSGKPVAYFDEDSLYTFEGMQIGWLEDGWIIDLQGDYVLFTEEATGGPFKPIQYIEPIKGVKQIKPIKGVKEISRLKPISILRWSNSSGSDFFE